MLLRVCLPLKLLFDKRCSVNLTTSLKIQWRKHPALRSVLHNNVASYYGGHTGMYVKLQFAFMHSNSFNCDKIMNTITAIITF